MALLFSEKQRRVLGRLFKRFFNAEFARKVWLVMLENGGVCNILGKVQIGQVDLRVVLSRSSALLQLLLRLFFVRKVGVLWLLHWTVWPSFHLVVSLLSNFQRTLVLPSRGQGRALFLALVAHKMRRNCRHIKIVNFYIDFVDAKLSFHDGDSGASLN